jgi:hypothetical protein
LTDNHKTAGTEQGAEVGWIIVQLLDLGPTRLIFVEFLCLFTGGCDQGALGSNLLGRGTFVDLGQNHFGFGDLSTVDELTGGLLSPL